ncbi:MAG: DHH family phosphoesterase [Nanoarchaeota archaeon]|nr:DHH family phosphoesterase [Nanoarchaeota archaeon]
MEIEYLKGSKKEFWEFVDLITSRDKVAIMTHTDLDGLASALFLEKLLNAKNIEVEYINFLNIKKDMVKELNLELNKKEITKVFFCDIAVESIDFQGYEELHKEMDVFVIDHHPMKTDFGEFKNIIKTNSDDCAALTIFDLGEGIFDTKAWEWVVASAIFSDYSYKREENFEYLKSIYPNISIENISSSIPGINGRKISSALVYYKENIQVVYDLVKERNMEKLTELYEIVEEEVNKIVEDFLENKKFYKTKDLYLYEVKSNFEVVSYSIGLVSKTSPEDTFVFYKRTKDGMIKFSARNQAKVKDMGELMRICTQGLEGSSGGGHVPAAAAIIQENDFKEFKRRLTKNC